MSISSAVCSVVYVDDNLNDHFLLHRAIKKTEAPIELHPFVTGRPAFDYIKTKQPTFVLCDYDLGARAKGSDLVASIRGLARCSELPIIMFSGADNPNALVESYDAGANYFLRKPTDLSRVITIVRALYACATANSAGFRTLVYLAEYEPRPSTTRSTSFARQFANVEAD